MAVVETAENISHPLHRLQNDRSSNRRGNIGHYIMSQIAKMNALLLATENVRHITSFFHNHKGTLSLLSKTPILPKSS